MYNLKIRNGEQCDQWKKSIYSNSLAQVTNEQISIYSNSLAHVTNGQIYI